jgi:hypothetical protein
VDSGECAGSGSLLLVGGARVTLGFGEDSTLGDKDDVFVGELLLELTGEAICQLLVRREGEAGLKSPAVNPCDPGRLTAAGPCGRP